MIKKIETREIREKRYRRNQLIIGIILVGLMLLSTVGYALMDQTGSSSVNLQKFTYKGIEFIQDESGYWKFNLNNYEFYTLHTPNDTKEINPIMFTNLQDYSGRPMYFVSEQGEALNEFARNLNERFTQRMQRACLVGSNCSEDLPIKNCSSDNVIVIRETAKNEKERVYQDQKCVYIIASYANQTRYSDAVLFKILGI